MKPFPRTRFYLFVLWLIGLLGANVNGVAQSVTQVGLRSINGLGQFRGLKADTAGNLYTLLDAQDGVRVVKMDASATQILAETQLGQAGDQGIALALDPTGNVYVAGISLSTGSVTGTTGTAFPSRADTTTNSFLAKFSPTLAPQWLTFLGSGRMAVTGVDATATQVVLTGGIYISNLPVTPNGIQQQPLPNSGANGFVESFSTATGTLNYSTYLSGANGDTQPTGIALDASGNAYVVGTTSASGFPTTNALVPLLLTDAASPVSGFLTKLTPAGDGFVFSTYIPGNGTTSVAVDPATSSVLVSGNIAAGLFPLNQVRVPIAGNLAYQTAVRLPLDGSAVTSATLLAPGTVSTVAAGTSGFVAAVSSDSAAVPPLLPVAPLGSSGSAFLLVADASGAVQRTARVGGVPVTNGGFAGVPVYSSGALLAFDGTALFAGGIAPTLSSALLGTEQYDVGLGPTATAALPSTVRDALPSSSCSGSACAGGAAVLGRMSPSSGAFLLLSVDALPNVTVRNSGGTSATGLQVTVTGYTATGTCGSSLAAGSECDVILSGNGPGTLQVSATNASTASAVLPATALAANPISVVPKELDFGITAAATPRTGTVTITNLTSAPQTFVSKPGVRTTFFTVSESASTCAPVGDGVSETVPANASCDLTLQLTPTANPANDGQVRATWILGPREVVLTGYAQAAALSLSATHLGFGRQYAGGLRVPRYLYVSNGSDAAQAHTVVTLSPTLPFQLTDSCPSMLAPQSVCRIAVTYASTVVPSSDAVTVSVDGIPVLIDGQTVQQPGVTGASTNPNLMVSSAGITFALPVVVTAVSTETQSVTIQNTGAAAFTLTLSVTGDFAASTCPASLAGGASCVVTLHFTPSDAGARQGLLSVQAGSSTPVYVALNGTATGFFPVSGPISFGDVPLQTPVVQWFKISQQFARLTVASNSTDFTVLLVEDQGYGYGSPGRTLFRQGTTATCFNCYLGVQFLPTQTGEETATLSFTSTSGGSALNLVLNGTGTPLSGVLLTPSASDFGTIPLGSTTGATVFTLTNASSAAISTSAAILNGDFAQSSAATGGTACGGTLQVGESCSIAVQFSPTAIGTRNGSVTVSTSAGSATSALTGFGNASSGVAFSPASLFFRNVPGQEATEQVITVTNTGSGAATIGTPVSSDNHFQVTTNCAALITGASCTMTVDYTPSNGLASGLLTVPITTSSGGATQTVSYTLPLTGLYTATNAGIQIVPGGESSVNFGGLATAAVSAGRVFRVNNLSGKSLTLALQAPRQFPITATNCGTLAPAGSCTVTLVYAPLLNAAATGTLTIVGSPTDGSAPVNGLAYVQGYGMGAGTMAVRGNFTANGVIDFGQVPAGQSATQALTVINQSITDTITVRRASVAFPFSGTSNCGAALAPQATCAVTVTYTPNAQTTVGGNAGTLSDTGVLTLESDAANSPLLVNLAGRTVPIQSNAPAPATPLAALTTSQGSLTFAAGSVGSVSAAQAITVTNTGTVALAVSGVVSSPDFTTSSNCGALPTGSSCQITVTFTPQTTGTRSGSLAIQSNAANALEFVSLLGNGTPASVSLTPTSLAYGQVLVGRTSAAQTATFTNTGASSVTVGTIGISGGFALATAGVSGTVCATGASLAAGASCVLPIVFTPSQTGTRSGTLSVASSATALPLTVTLSGVGVQPQLTVSPTSLQFGDVLIGKSATLALTLTNVSVTAVNALQFGITTGDYSITGNCGPVTLGVGSSCSLNVTFTPTQAGARTGALTIASSDPASPITVPLTGNGLQGGSFTLTANGAASASATVVAGISATYALAVTPVNGFTGAVALTCAPQAIVQYTSCSINPSNVTLTNGAVNATATITTVSGINSAQLEPMRRWNSAVLCAFPVLLLVGWRRKGGWRVGLLAALVSVAVWMGGGCGSGPDPRIRYAAPGTYQFLVTAASTTSVPAQQSVTLNLTVTKRP